MTSGSFYAALDIGGTHARLAFSLPGEPVRFYERDGFTLTQNGPQDVKRRLRELLAKPLEDAGMKPTDCIRLCCGASGIDDENSRRQYKDLFAQLGFAEDRVQVYNDCELILAEYGKPALLIVSGTGSLTMARDENGRLFRSGGWGFFTGDHGSACRIVIDALSAAVRAWDGSCQADMLLKLLTEEGITAPAEAERFVREYAADKRRIAGFAPAVFKAAEMGDIETKNVIASNARLLGQDAVNCARQAKLEKPAVLLWGSLLTETDGLRVPLMDYLRSEIGAHELSVEKTALEAAMALARRA